MQFLVTLFWRSFVQLIFPRVCFHCACHIAQDKLFCSACQKGVHLFSEESSLSLDWLGRFQSKDIQFLLPLWIYEKQGMVAGLIHDFKYNGHKALGRYAALHYAEYLGAQHNQYGFDIILYAPMHWWRLSRRGFNQSQIIARVVARVLGVPCYARLLVRVKHTQRQVGKGAQERRANMRNVFRVRDESLVQGKRVLLIDDVITTGATLLACAETLLKAGAARIYTAGLAGRIED